MALHHHTPLLHSLPLSHLTGKDIWLKMESAQPSASFKLRGMGLAAQRAVAKGATRLVSSSGGNAGYAVAWAGQKLGVPVTVVVPETTNQDMRQKIRHTGAEVKVFGRVWDDAHTKAIEVAKASDGALLHPFDHPDIWEGHASMIDEIYASGLRPGLVLVAVGGGGLLCGVLQGIESTGWSNVPVLGIETTGAASFAAAKQAGKPVTLSAITSLAKTLGAKRVCDELMMLTARHTVHSVVVSDAAAVNACVRFADDHRTLVEPSCGAALSLVYDDHEALRSANGPVLVVVCGGAGVTMEQLRQWQRQTQR